MDDEQVKTTGELLNGILINELSNLEQLDPEKKKAKLNEIETLYKIKIDELKVYDLSYDNEQKRIMDKAEQQRRYELDLQKIKLEAERLEADRLHMEQELNLNKSQAASEKHRMWLEIGSRGIAIGAWMYMSFKVMKFEEVGTIRSKAFLGTLPKLKFW